MIEMPDLDGYPTEEELKGLYKLACDSDYLLKNIDEFLEQIRDLWWRPDWGFKYESNGKLELHTGGWSGNEDVVSKLENTTFWLMYWSMSKRGGHYWFDIPKAALGVNFVE
jgi:hypothetical protein